ncbi:MAG: hypothetical protein ABIU54_02035 [Candidatus Eisenbacteria bacterium]
MKRMIGSLALLVLAATLTLAPKASGQCVTGTGTNILMKWDGNGFVYETATNNPLGALANPVNNISTAGNTLHALMGVSLFCGPLAGLDPNDPAAEYTIVWTGLTSGGTSTSPFGTSGTKYTTVYLNGGWTLYRGAVDARNYANVPPPAPAVAFPQYNETVVLLSGPMDSLVVTVTKSSLGNINGSFRGRYRVTGGTMSGSICNNAAGLVNGLWYPVNPPAGYSAHHNGKYDAPDCATSTRNTSWGRIKTLYR